MSAQKEPNSQLNFGWEYGEDHWDVGTEENWLRIGRFAFHLSAKSRTVTQPSTLNPANGDTYIVPDNASGVWSSRANNVAVWDSKSNAWVYATPGVGWVSYIEDEEVLSAYKSSGWSSGLAI